MKLTGAKQGFDDWFHRETLKTLDDAEASNEQYIQFVHALLQAKDTSFTQVKSMAATGSGWFATGRN